MNASRAEKIALSTEITDDHAPLSLVFIDRDAVDEGAVLRSSGVVAAEHSIWGRGYVNHAYFPRPDWRPLDIPQRDALYRQISTDLGREIMVVDMRGPGFEALAKMVANYGHSAAMREDVQIAFEAILVEHVDIVNHYKYLGAEMTFDSAPTLTWETDGRRTGLHVDSWSNLPIADRWKSPNRLCLNLGQGDRYLLFVNRGIDEAREILDNADRLDRPNSENVTTLTASFLKYMPDSPVYAVRIRPGEAYVAPTEYVIHDGFVPGRLPNATISVMGYISPKKKV